MFIHSFLCCFEVTRSFILFLLLWKLFVFTNLLLSKYKKLSRVHQPTQAALLKHCDLKGKFYWDIHHRNWLCFLRPPSLSMISKDKICFCSNRTFSHVQYKLCELLWCLFLFTVLLDINFFKQNFYNYLTHYLSQIVWLQSVVLMPRCLYWKIVVYMRHQSCEWLGTNLTYCIVK